MAGHYDESHRKQFIESIFQAGWVKQLDWFAEIDSTNDYLKRAIVHDGGSGQEFRLPWLVVADEQTSGRGRGRAKMVVA